MHNTSSTHTYMHNTHDHSVQQSVDVQGYIAEAAHESAPSPSSHPYAILILTRTQAAVAAYEFAKDMYDSCFAGGFGCFAAICCMPISCEMGLVKVTVADVCDDGTSLVRNELKVKIAGQIDIKLGATASYGRDKEVCQRDPDLDPDLTLTF